MSRLLDFGSVYASKSFALRDGRRLWLGWSFETSKGCDRQCSLGTPLTALQVRERVHAGAFALLVQACCGHLRLTLFNVKITPTKLRDHS